jgi:YhcG PDDEXK nuclease domain
VQQAAAQLPWFHLCTLVDKLKTQKDRNWYLAKAVEHNCLAYSPIWLSNRSKTHMFYHLKLRCYVVVELKAGAFKPEHAGQLGFYLTAVDMQMKTEQDNPTIGLLLCKSKNKVVAEYALRDSNKPIGVAEYQLIESVPKELQTSLPSIEALENALMLSSKNNSQ